MIITPIISQILMSFKVVLLRVLLSEGIAKKPLVEFPPYRVSTQAEREIRGLRATVSVNGHAAPGCGTANLLHVRMSGTLGQTVLCRSPKKP